MAELEGVKRDVTLEDAGRCPKCDQPGMKAKNVKSEMRGTKIHMFKCQNKDCKWYDTGWPVQQNADGTIAQPDHRSNRHFNPYPALTPDQEAAAQREIEMIKRADNPNANQ